MHRTGEHEGPDLPVLTTELNSSVTWAW
jgi:hypothetical protein